MSCIWCKGRQLPDHDCENFAQFEEEDMPGKMRRATDGRSGRCPNCGKVVKSARNETIEFAIAVHIGTECAGAPA